MMIKSSADSIQGRYRTLSKKKRLVLACLLVAPLARYLVVILGWLIGYYSSSALKLFGGQAVMGWIGTLLVVPFTTSAPNLSKFVFRSSLWGLALVAGVSLLVILFSTGTASIWPYKWIWDSCLAGVQLALTAAVGWALNGFIESRTGP